jgi:hypothetical protein
VPRRSSVGWSGWAVEPLWEVPDRPLLRLRAAQRLWGVPARAQPPVASEERDGKWIGRSRVACSDSTGILQNGFPFPGVSPGLSMVDGKVDRRHPVQSRGDCLLHEPARR